MEQETLSTQIRNYIHDRLSDKLEKLDKEIEKKRKSTTIQSELTKFEAEYQDKRAALEVEYSPIYWLTKASKRAKQISLATHVIKFTHPDAKGTSIYSIESQTVLNDVPPNSYLSTANLPTLTEDVTGNAASLDVAKLLLLKQNGMSLIESLNKGDYAALKPFSNSEEQLETWVEGLKQAFVDRENLSSHTLTKQLYFPIDRDTYHLLAPLYASSFSQALYQKIRHNRFHEEQIAARKAKPKGKYSAQLVTNYPNTARQNFGGRKPQNISQLNTTRHGESYLLSAAPPVWEGRLKPPLRETSIFNAGYDRRAHKIAKELQQYLLNILSQPSTKDRRDRRAGYVDSLIEKLLYYAAEIRNLEPGWSVESKLHSAQQLWLDQDRDDESFKQEREKGDWQQQIVDQFATWLNQKLKHTKLSMGDVEHREWKKLLSHRLRLLKDDLDEWL